MQEALFIKRSVAVALAVVLAGVVDGRADEGEPPGAGSECEPESLAYPEIHSCGTVSQNVRLGSFLFAGVGTCLVPVAAGITIDGCGLGIVTTGNAVDIRTSGVRVRNLRTNGTIRVYGQDASSATIEHSEMGGYGPPAGGLRVFGADDVRVEKSRMDFLRIENLYASSCPDSECSPQRAVVRDNVVESGERLLLRFSGGRYICPRGNHLIEGNRVTGTGHPLGQQQEAFYFRCFSHSTVVDNEFRTLGLGRGFWLRDSASHNHFEGNTVWLDSAYRGALAIESGNDDKLHPADNVFVRNVFRTDHGPAASIQAICARRNVFRENLFRNGDDGPSGYLANSYVRGRNNLFEHNTFYREQPGTLIHIDNRIYEYGPGVAENCSDLSEPENRWRSNVFTQAAGRGDIVDIFDALRYDGDYNVFWNADGPVVFRGRVQGGRGNFPVWQYLGHDPHSVEGDPRFVDPASGDFRLGPDSAARGVAEDGGDAGAFPAAE